MSTNSVNIGWNKYETALLIDSFLSYTEGTISRKDAIAQLSKRLRDRMVKLGMSISDTYRNENGIDLQLRAIEYVLTDGASGLSNPSKLFLEIGNLSKEDKQSFQQILRIANIMYPSDTFEETTTSNNIVQHQSKGLQNTVVSDSSAQSYHNSKIKTILKKKFPKGYRLSSPIETKKMLRYFEEEYGYELDLEMTDIDQNVKSCGIVHETRVYLPELMLDEQVKQELINYISDSFSSGKSCVYYSVLFDVFHDSFLDNIIYDSEMLREYLEYINIFGWHFNPLYLSDNSNSSNNILQEVIEYVKNRGTVVSENEVVKGLSYLPEDSVRNAFNVRDTDLISCGRKLRFHIDNFILSNEELEKILLIIQLGISKYQYIGFSELLIDIKNQLPQVIDDNIVFTEIGLRKVLAKRLSRKISFINNIISSLERPLTAEDCFKQLSKRDKFSIQDVNKLAEDCGTLSNVYIELLLKYSCRVTLELFVSHKFIHFDIDAIDSVLMRFCDKDYIALKDINTLTVLPCCEYPWTPFLLESYVYNHSKLFKLIKSGYFGQKNTVGAIVKRSSNIDSFVDLAARTIADSNISLTEKEALDLLYNKGFIAKRRNENIKTIIETARQLKKNK